MPSCPRLALSRLRTMATRARRNRSESLGADHLARLDMTLARRRWRFTGDRRGQVHRKCVYISSGVRDIRSVLVSKWQWRQTVGLADLAPLRSRWPQRAKQLSSRHPYSTPCDYRAKQVRASDGHVRAALSPLVARHGHSAKRRDGVTRGHALTAWMKNEGGVTL